MRNLSSWSSVDLEAIQRTVTATSPPFHELDALRWLVKEFRDTPTMIPHLQEILETYPPHLVIPAVLNQWFFHPSREWTKEDIGAALRHPAPFDSSGDFSAESPVRLSGRKGYLGKELFDRLLHWNHIAANISLIPAEDHPILPKFLENFCSQIKANHWTGFPVSFCIMDGLFEDEHSRELGLSIWRTCEEIQMKWSSDRQLPFDTLTDDLARYITSTEVDHSSNITSIASPFLITPDGLTFMKHLHAYGLQVPIITHGEGTERWAKATKIIQQLHHLPEDTFVIRSGRFDLVTLAFERTWNDPLSLRKFDREFPYFDFFKEHWRGENTYLGKRTLVAILSRIIRASTQDANTASHLEDLGPSLNIMSSAGLDLLTFVNGRLVEESKTYHLHHPEMRTLLPNLQAWKDALQHVKEVLDLPPDYFEPIILDGGDPTPDNAQSTNHGDFPGEVGIRNQPGAGEMPAEATSSHADRQEGHEKRAVRMVGGPDAAENV
ncbi:hypothetical protein PQX77_002383 [Marasmius sp. AFHP31]|nr:hypothetical protein PQX77_002383 [Marasmius sp. AFHP31]